MALAGCVREEGVGEAEESAEPVEGKRLQFGAPGQGQVGSKHTRPHHSLCKRC